MMGVKVKKEYRIRRVAEQWREKIRRFPESHKVRNGGKNYSRCVRDRTFKNGNSREVLVRITGSGRTPLVVKNEINYIAREGELTLRDSEGKEYFIKEREERKQSYAFMTDWEDKLVYKDESAPKLVHNIVFSALTVASISEADAFKTVETTLKEKYPDNRFVMAYHKDTDSHHVHVLLRIPDNYGKRINIRKQDLRELREKFYGQLQKMGYNVTCTHKYQFGLKSELKREYDRQRGLYEVVKFGRASYRFNHKNGDQNYITLRTLKNKTEVTYWGVNLAEEIEREQIKPGSVISFKKDGDTAVKVPKLDRQGKQVGWTETHRNNWRIENQEAIGIKTKPFPKEIKLDSPEQLIKHKRSMAVFKQSKEAMLAMKE
ncbi:MAG: MobP1 family relaxase [Symbiopectobacterium sp.]|uniref:MobP1 family relaxase n=1 Tax=Symbiopectobacterium sp. TaxID=2952789 RepID=UPI003F337AC4